MNPMIPRFCATVYALHHGLSLYVPERLCMPRVVIPHCPFCSMDFNVGIIDCEICILTSISSIYTRNMRYAWSSPIDFYLDFAFYI